PILALFAAGQWMQVDAGKKYLLIACLFGLTGWLLNPYGIRLLFLPQRIAEIDQVSLISEWMPFFGGAALERTVYVTAILLAVLWAFFMVNSEGPGRNWRWLVGAVLILMMM